MILYRKEKKISLKHLPWWQALRRMFLMGATLDQIRKAIEYSSKSRYRIWKETGITQGQLSRLMKGERGLSLDALERLTDCLGLEVVIRPKRGRKGR